MKQRYTFGIVCCTILAFALTLSCTGDENGDAIIGDMYFIGRGYDVFSSYADSLEVKSSVLDFDRMYNDGLIEKIQLEKSEFQTIEGTDVDEYMSKLSVDAGVSGSYKGFSGSVEVNFDSSHYMYSEYSFATVQSLIQKYSVKITLNTSTETLKSYLTDHAKNAINDTNVEPEELFITYGTHVLRGIIIGGRIDYNVSADMSQVVTSKSIGVHAEAGYEGAFSVNVKSDVVTEDEKNSFNSERKKSLKVYGGSSEYGQYIINEVESGYQPWIESIKDNPVFCEFDRTTPIIPIWDFCDQSTQEGIDRAAALEAGYAAYASKRALSTSPFPRACIVSIEILNQGSALPSLYNSSTFPDGHYAIVQDLNEGSGGRFIYIKYKYGMDIDTDPAPITSLHISNNGTLGSPYIKPEGFCDLNQGAGGAFIYLYYGRGGAQPIRSLHTADYNGDMVHEESFYTAESGTDNNDGARTYSVIPYDLNAGADGDYIYLGYSYDYVD